MIFIVEKFCICRVLLVVFVVIVVIGYFLCDVFGFFVESVDIDVEKMLFDIVCGGVMNYCIGKFDDGMDVVGWYEKD